MTQAGRGWPSRIGMEACAQAVTAAGSAGSIVMRDRLSIVSPWVAAGSRIAANSARFVSAPTL